MNKIILKTLLISGFALIYGLPADAQYTLVYGDKSIQLSGMVSSYYNHRFLKEGELDKKNNRFRLRDMQLGVNARWGSDWELKIRADIADLAESTMAEESELDPENPGLMSAYIEYKRLPVNIKLGYDKLPYSQGSLQSFDGSVFWQRGEMMRGSFFSRRDIGMTLSSTFWKQRINVYAGVYTGLGENIIGNNDNDPSGRLEYLARVDVAYPARYRYVESDILNVPIPMVRFGGNVRYTNKTQPAGETLPGKVGGDYGLRVIDGKKLIYGFDGTFQYRGFSVQFETQILKLTPGDSQSSLFYNTHEALHKGVVFAGGWQAQVNYAHRSINSVVSARYENYNLNDLVLGQTRRLNIGYSYLFNGYNAAFKIHYYRILEEEYRLNALKWTDQIRVGIQYLF